MIKAVLTSPGHPEYGEVTVPFPIPDVEYDHAMELLRSHSFTQVAELTGISRSTVTREARRRGLRKSDLG